MTKKIVTRTLMIAGLVVASATASFAQAPAVAKVRRVAADKENLQPVAASVVALEQSGTLNLSADQRTKLEAMSSEAVSLQTERARLWNEYREIVSRPNFSDDIAAAEAAPRMLRIVEINAKLAPVAAKQESQVATILSGSQRSQLAKAMTSVRTNL